MNLLAGQAASGAVPAVGTEQKLCPRRPALRRRTRARLPAKCSLATLSTNGQCDCGTSDAEIVATLRSTNYPLEQRASFEPDGSYRQGLVYGRTANPNRTQLETAVAALEGGGVMRVLLVGCRATESAGRLPGGRSSGRKFMHLTSRAHHSLQSRAVGLPGRCQRQAAAV